MRQAHSTSAARNRGLPSFGHAARYPFTAATVFARTQPGVGTDGAPVGEAFPRADLAGHHHRG